MTPHVAARLAPLFAVMMLGAATPAIAASDRGPPDLGALPLGAEPFVVGARR